MSKGEGHERRIVAFKTDSEPSKDIVNTNSVASNSLSSFDVNVTEVNSFSSVEDSDITPSRIENHIINVDDTEMQSLDEYVTGSQQPCEEAVDRTRDMAEHIGMNDLAETAAVLDKNSSPVPTEYCSNCGKQIPHLNYQLHLLHCKTSAGKSRSKKSKDTSANKVTCLVSNCGNIYCK